MKIGNGTERYRPRVDDFYSVNSVNLSNSKIFSMIRGFLDDIISAKMGKKNHACFVSKFHAQSNLVIVSGRLESRLECKALRNVYGEKAGAN